MPTNRCSAALPAGSLVTQPSASEPATNTRSRLPSEEETTHCSDQKLPGALIPGDGVTASAAIANQAFVDAGCTWKSVAKIAFKDRAQLINQELSSRIFVSGGGQAPRNAAGITTPGALTYGEVPTEEAFRVLRLAQPKPGETFVDIGSGRGQIVVGMCLEWAGVLKECVGIEALPNLVELSQSVGKIAVAQSAATVTATASTSSLSGNALTTQLRFSCADFLKQDLSWMDADIIWVTATCFPDSWMSAKGVLGSKFSQLKAGTRVCLTTHRLAIPRLRCVNVVSDLRPSWGHDTARVYVVEDDESDKEAQVET
jgi:hypothetical protein